MVEAYWHMGKRIIEEEQHGKERAAYGEQILKEHSKELTTEYSRGFSYSIFAISGSFTLPATMIRFATHCVAN